MKIAFVVASFAAKSGGPPLDSLILARQLRERFGHTTQIITWQTDGRQLPAGGETLVELPALARWTAWRAMVRQFRGLLAAQDVVFVSGIWGPTDGLLLRLCWPEHVPVYIRTCGMLEAYIMARHPLRKQAGRKGYVDHNLRRASGVIVASSAEAARLHHLGFVRNVQIIKSGLPPTTDVAVDRGAARDTLGLSPEGRCVLYLGRIHPKKGLHVLLEAASDAMRSGAPCPKILVAGPWTDSDYRQQIERLAARPELKGCVQFLGEVFGATKEAAFAAADAFILPSASEGVPNSVLEALARGLLCILTPGCNVPEITEYNAGRIVGADIPAICSALEWMADEHVDLSTFRANARRLSAEVFNFDASMEAYQALITAKGANHLVPA